MDALDLKKLRQIGIVEFDPFAIKIILWVTLSLALVTNCMSAISVHLMPSEAQLTSTWLTYITLIITGVHLLFCIFFSSKKRAYRYQKAQSLIMCVFLFKAFLDIYLLYFIVCDVRNSPSVNVSIGLMFLILGVVYWIVITWLRIRGYNFKEEFRIEETEDSPLVVFDKKSKRARVISYSIYMFIIIIASILSKYYGYFEEGYSLALLYHAVIVQYFAANKLSKGILVAYYKFKDTAFQFDDATLKNLREKINDVSSKPGCLKLIMIIAIQFLCLITLGVLSAEAFYEPVYPVMISAYVVLFIIFLRWVSQYYPSNLGKRYINAYLGGISFSVILSFFVFVGGRESFEMEVGTLFLAVGMIPFLFFQLFDIFAFIRRR